MARMKLLNRLGILCLSHHGAFHIYAAWFPVHCCIATDNLGWRLLDGQGASVRIVVGFYRMKHQYVVVIGSLSFRLDCKP